MIDTTGRRFIAVVNVLQKLKKIVTKTLPAIGIIIVTIGYYIFYSSKHRNCCYRVSCCYYKHFIAVKKI